MRATSTRRLLGGAAALMLAGATLLTASGAAVAGRTGTTRLLYVGPNSDYSTDAGILKFTPVSVGQKTLSTVYVKNVDNQTLTHVVITFTVDQGGLVISQVIGANASSCSSDGTTVTCDFGNLAARATRTFSLVATATASGPQTLLGRIVFNESNNPNGGNTQISKDEGSVTVGEATCDSLATFLLPDTAGDLTPDSGNCSIATDPQRSGLIVPGSANGNVVSINDHNPVNPGTCGAYVCFGNEVLANVNDAQTILPYLTWKITYAASVIGNINPRSVGFQHGTTIIAGKKAACGATFVSDCIAGYVVNGDGSVTWTIRTKTNSVMKGLH